MDGADLRRVNELNVEPLVLYYQLTLGPAHLARVSALDEQPTLRCRGVQLASQEKTRAFSLSRAEMASIDTIADGAYEDIPHFQMLRMAKQHFLESGAAALIIDSPADLIQYRIGRFAQRRGCRVFTRWAATVLDHPRHAWKEWLKGFVYRCWDGYLATGERGVEYLQSFGVADSDIHVCGNPVHHAPLDRVLSEQTNMPREDNFIFVGRFLRLKNLESFARAYLRYLDWGGRFRLDLVGFGESESAVRDLLGDQSKVKFHGHLQFEELIPQYLRAGAVVLPSYSENWGLVVNEAMHAGAPVIVSKAAGCYPALVEEGGNGFGLDWESETAMAECLLRFEALTLDKRRAMSERSREIIANHTVDRWASRVAEAILRGR